MYSCGLKLFITNKVTTKSEHDQREYSLHPEMIQHANDTNTGTSSTAQWLLTFEMIHVSSSLKKKNSPQNEYQPVLVQNWASVPSIDLGLHHMGTKTAL